MQNVTYLSIIKSDIIPLNNKYKTLGRRLKGLRETLKLNQSGFAKKLGPEFDQSRISSYERGKNYPSPKLLKEMLKLAPQINGHWLLTGEGPMELSIENQQGYHVAESDKLTSDIRRVVNYLEGMDEPTREAALQILATLTRLSGDED